MGTMMKVIAAAAVAALGLTRPRPTPLRDRPGSRPKPRGRPHQGGGPILDRGSRRNMRRIEAVNHAAPSEKAKMLHSWYQRQLRALEVYL